MAKTAPAIKQLAGRLVLGRIPGLTLDDAHRQALKDGTIGGVTLFKENVSDLRQLATLTGEIIETSHHNCLIAVDQEGGAVQRFDQVLTPLPSPMALAALAITDERSYIVETITRISAGELKKLGVNMLLAPTLDLQTNPRNPIICTRAFGDNPERVARLGGRVAAAIKAEGLIAVGKHFPGHGSTSEDSHLELACVDKSEAALLATDVLPFARLAGKLQAILVGHIWLPQLVEEKIPATLSKKIIQDLLQEQLGFNGLVVSDDMIMKAITTGLGLGEACVQALLAGIDLLLVCGTMEETLEAVDAIAEAAESGRVSKERLLEAAAKVSALTPFKQAYLDAGDQDLLARFQQEIDINSSLSRKCSANAIAELGGDGRSAPQTAAPGQYLANQKCITVVAPRHPRYPINLAADLRLALADDVKVIEVRYHLDPTAQEVSSVVAEAEGQIIFVTYRSVINKGQAALGQALAKKTSGEGLLIHVASDSPYDLTCLTGIDLIVSLASFDPSCQAMAGLADVLTGKARPEGRCPLQLAQTV